MMPLTDCQKQFDDMYIRSDAVPGYRHWTHWRTENIELCTHCMLTRDKNTQNCMLSLTGKGRFGRKSIFDIPVQCPQK